MPGHRFDRIIATCASVSVPLAWLAQARPGGRILITLTGWQYGFALVRVTVTGPDTAAGEFLDRPFSFMLARAQENPRRPVRLPEIGGEPARPARYGPGTLSSDAQDAWMHRWLAQLALPFSTYYPVTDPSAITYVHDLASDSWAWLRAAGEGGYEVGQAGPVRVWDTIERAISQWEQAGSPRQPEFTLSITGSRQVVSHPEMTDSWLLPAGPP